MRYVCCSHIYLLYLAFFKLCCSFLENFIFEATRMDANQVDVRSAETGLSKEEKQAVRNKLEVWIEMSSSGGRLSKYAYH